MKRKHWVLLLTLIAAMLLLSGCGVQHEGVDVMHTAPQGTWQTLVVWPLAKALIWLDGALDRILTNHSRGVTIST